MLLPITNNLYYYLCYTIRLVPLTMQYVLVHLRDLVTFSLLLDWHNKLYTYNYICNNSPHAPSDLYFYEITSRNIQYTRALLFTLHGRTTHPVYTCPTVYPSRSYKTSSIHVPYCLPFTVVQNIQYTRALLFTLNGRTIQLLFKLQRRGIVVEIASLRRHFRFYLQVKVRRLCLAV